jgi:uncharacterized membrane protein
MMTPERRYTRDLLLWIGLYAVLLVGSELAFGRVAIPSVLRIPLALVPMIAGFGLIATVLRRWRTMDELERRMQSEALAFSVGLTAMLTFSYGFLELHADAPVLSYFWVWPILAAGWIIGLVIVRRRYQ